MVRDASALRILPNAMRSPYYEDCLAPIRQKALATCAPHNIGAVLRVEEIGKLVPCDIALAGSVCSALCGRKVHEVATRVRDEVVQPIDLNTRVGQAAQPGHCILQVAVDDVDDNKDAAARIEVAQPSPRVAVALRGADPSACA